MEAKLQATFADEYQQALADFVLGGTGEPALMKAYQLGRRAVVERQSILDLAALHQHAMLTTVLRRVLRRAPGEYLARGEEFFAQVMAPFEMMQRGYTDTIQQLQEVNRTLEQRVEERTRALRESERKIARLARLYAVLSGINSAIVRLRDRDELFRETCRIAVDQGGFALAWVGLRESERSVTPMAWCSQGDEADARAAVESIVGLSGDDTARVLQKGLAVVRQVAGEGETGPALGPIGYRVYALLPLVLSDAAVGVLALYRAESASLDPEERRLLDELAGDLSFALEHMKREQQLTYIAYYDTLTGLPNASLLSERLTRQIQTARREGTRVALLLVDLARFSNVNDTYGRHIGDQLLKQVGARLDQAVEQPDTVARMSADKFAVMLTGLVGADQVAYKLESEVLSGFARPFRSGDSEIYLSARVGISLYPEDATTAEEMFKDAEIALKRAQQEGEIYLVYNPAMNARIVRAVTLEAKLRNAIERDQLVVHYQPKVAAEDGRIVGLEALVRFVDPDGGTVPPAQFIPLLEETGMIIEVGGWVMHRAAADYLRWREQGLLPPRIAVNVSALQMQHREFVPSLSAVAHTLDDVGVGLDIELTESAVMEDVEQSIVKLEAARALGFRVAVDDFGTGYSSLSYLSRLPINALKIDRSFIVTMAERPESLAIVSTIISLAHALSLEVIAEGVELEEQAKLLRLLRCEQIQGDLYGRALPADEIAALFGAG